MPLKRAGSSSCCSFRLLGSPASWVTGTLLPLAAPALKGQGRAQGQVQVPRSLYVDRSHTVLFMSVLLSPLQHRLNTTDRSRTTSVSLDKFKFVPPSFDIVRGLSCSASRGSRRFVSCQHHTHTHTSVLTPTCLCLWSSLLLSTSTYIHLCTRLSSGCLPSISEKVRLHLPPVGIGQPFHPIFRATPRPPCDCSGPLYHSLPHAHTTHTHTHTSARAVHMVPCFPPPTNPRSFWLPL